MTNPSLRFHGPQCPGRDFEWGRSAGRSFWKGARLMLHAEGIVTFESDVDAVGGVLGSAFMQRESRLFIPDEADVPRASAILLELGAYRGPTAVQMPWRASWTVRLLLCRAPDAPHEHSASPSRFRSRPMLRIP